MITSLMIPWGWGYLIGIASGLVLSLQPMNVAPTHVMFYSTCVTAVASVVIAAAIKKKRVMSQKDSLVFSLIMTVSGAVGAACAIPIAARILS